MTRGRWMLVLALVVVPALAEGRVVIRPRAVEAGASAPTSRDSARAARVDSLGAALPADIARRYEVDWDAESGCVTQVRLRDDSLEDPNCVLESLHDDHAVGDALDFFADHPALFGTRAGEDELHFSRESSRTCGGTSHLVFSTWYRGREVWNVRFNVRVSEFGTVLALDGAFAHDLDLDPAPQTSVSQARTSLEALLSDRRIKRAEFSDLRFERFMGRWNYWGGVQRVADPPVGWFLVWPIVASDDNGGIWIATVDAHAGRVLSCVLEPHLIR